MQEEVSGGSEEGRPPVPGVLFVVCRHYMGCNVATAIGEVELLRMFVAVCSNKHKIRSFNYALCSDETLQLSAALETAAATASDSMPLCRHMATTQVSSMHAVVVELRNCCCKVSFHV